MIKTSSIIFIAILLSGIAGFAGPPDKVIPATTYLDSFLLTSESESLETIEKEYVVLLKYFVKRQEKIKDQAVFIELVFDKVQEVFLHNYVQYAGFGEILTNNTFDCATATALYVSFLSDLGIDFEIWETNYHSYIKIKTEESMILLESTDPLNGFNTGDAVDDLEKKYLMDNMEGYLYENGIDIHRMTTPDEYIGLLHFNQAVKSYNEGNYLKAMGQIQQAEIKYPSDRIFLLKEIIMDRVVLVSTSSL